MMLKNNTESSEHLSRLVKALNDRNKFSEEDYTKYDVKLGLRNRDGTGVLAGLTQICNVHGYIINEFTRIPHEGELYYCGVNVVDIVNNCIEEDRFGFEEVVWLLLFGKLPNKDDMELMRCLLQENRELPEGFMEDMIMKAPSPNIMNKLGRSVMALYTYDENPDDTSVENLLRQSIKLIACMPSAMISAYQVKRRHYDHKSIYLHPPIEGLSFAENILSQLRSDRKYTHEEAKLLDLCLMLHAEHGGGNNSTFVCRVLSSTGTDTYSAIAGAIGSLKGPKHGGANIKVVQMLDYMKAGISDYDDDEEIASFLRKIVAKEVGDGSGLIYGMGHAVYTLSDPRCKMLKSNAYSLAKENGYEDDYKLLDAVERLAPDVLMGIKGNRGEICANVDLYSGLVYRMLRIPTDLYTPIFAVARMAGWCAHRIEECTTCKKIMRPAYKSVFGARDYIKMEDR